LGGVLGGIATGIGVSWLMHSMGWGIGEEMESCIGGIFLMIFAVPILLLMIRRFSSGAPFAVRQSMFGFGNSAQSTTLGSPNNPIQFTQYKPKNVGNDASARPWEGVGSEPDLVSSSSQNSYKSIYGRVPEGFDVGGFVGTAKQVFLALQVAWDTFDMATLHSMLTDQMLSEIKSQLGERAQHSNSHDNKTEVITLQAELLGVQELDNVYMASVEFSGLIREDQTQGPNSFREVWSMSKQRDGSSGWLVCGVQALQ
jgi:predicted lipid-binding transport protein (Tim44 family)